MIRETPSNSPLELDIGGAVKRRKILRFGTLLTAVTGATAISALEASDAHADLGETNPVGYVPMAEKGAASGVATLDLQAKIPSEQVPDLSAIYATVIGVPATLGNDSTNASAGIQVALDQAHAAGGGTVYIPDGIYRLQTTLKIGSNTHLQLSKRATMKRGSATNSLLQNKHDGTTGGYGQASNIRVSGGTWDGNAGSWATNCTIMSFGHADGVTLESVTFKNLFGFWHEVELNGVRGGRVINCRFLDRVNGGSRHAEMVQLDLMYGPGGFPWFGPYDNTPCMDILIQGNEFRNGVNAIGNHAAIEGALHHKDIRVLGNLFENMIDSALRFLAFENVIIESNNARECRRFIWATQAYAPLSGIIIRGNTATNTTVQDTIEGRGVHVVGGSSVSDRKISGVVIDSNVISGMGRFGITLNYVDGAVISGNRVKDTGMQMFGNSNSTTGMWIYKAANTRILANAIDNTAPSSTHADTADVIIGVVGGASTDTPNTVFANNLISRLRLGSLSILISHDNNIAISRILNGTRQSDLREHHNMIGGVWTM